MNSYEYGDAFQVRLLAAYVKRHEKFASVVEPAFFTHPVHVDIARVVRDAFAHQDDKKLRLAKSTLKELVRSSLRERSARIREIWPPYRPVIRRIFKIPMTDAEILRAQAADFAKETDVWSSRSAIIIEHPSNARSGHEKIC